MILGQGIIVMMVQVTAICECVRRRFMSSKYHEDLLHASGITMTSRNWVLVKSENTRCPQSRYVNISMVSTALSTEH